jgi:hypothetical protein
MLKNSDYIYTIGHGHRTCDDFAFTRSFPVDFAGFKKMNISIVADGCSSSKNSDIGSRLICSKIINNFHQGYVAFPICVGYFINACYEEVYKEYHAIYGDSFLDCTLLIATTESNITKVYMIGDGCILYQKKDGNEVYSMREFENNAPAYFSYILNKERQNNYLDFSHYYTDTLVSNNCLTIKKDTTKVSMTDIPIQEYSFNHEDTKYLMLFTDGLNSFVDTSKDFSYYAQKMLDIKNENGVFLQRQVQGICRIEEKLNNFHEDDLSGVALIFE